MARSPDLASSATKGQVSKPGLTRETAVRQKAERKDSMRPPALWHQLQLVQDLPSHVLDGRAVAICVFFSKFSSDQGPRGNSESMS